MSIALVLPDRESRGLAKSIGTIAPDINVQRWPAPSSPEKVILSLAWGPLPIDLFSTLPNLRAIVSAGAGVDSLMAGDIPENVALGRLVLRSLAQDMSAYCVSIIVHRSRHFDVYQVQQSNRRWKPQSAMRPNIGILGMGQLGRHLAAVLETLGFQVSGWRRTRASDSDFHVFSGSSGLDKLARQSDVLVCLLPLTSETRGILSRRLFSRLKTGAYLINVGRGGHLVDQDLLYALDQGWVSGACLDVFEPEPLPAEHPFWSDPRIRMTPHVASVTNEADAAAAIVEDYRRLVRGEPLANPVDRKLGY